MNIQYYKMRFRLVSPFSVGSGSNANTDSDVVLDSRGRPVIPATALAGVIRHACEGETGNQNHMFGYIGAKASADSRIRFYDAEAETDTVVTVRDMVALGNNVGISGAKFDREAVETNAEFVTLFELRDVSEENTALFLGRFLHSMPDIFGSDPKLPAATVRFVLHHCNKRHLNCLRIRLSGWRLSRMIITQMLAIRIFHCHILKAVL